MAAKEFLLGNKAKDLYLYTKQIVRPVPDNKVDAKDVAKVLRQIATAKTTDEMKALLVSTASRVEKRRERPRFPKSETYDLVADIRSTTKAIIKGIHAANETNFNVDPKSRLKQIKVVIDECNLLLTFVEIALELTYIDIKRSATWTKKITDVKYMCLAWLKKDTARAQKVYKENDSKELERLVVLIREITRKEGKAQS